MSGVFGRARLLGFGLLAVTFLVGALAGAAIERVAGDGTPAAEARQSDRQDNGRERSYIIDRVEMSDAQRATIDSILDLRTHRMRAVWQEVEPRLDAITDSTRAEIMAVLTAEQRAEYEHMLEHRRRERSGDRGQNESADSTASAPADPATTAPADSAASDNGTGSPSDSEAGPGR